MEHKGTPSASPLLQRGRGLRGTHSSAQRLTITPPLTKGGPGGSEEHKGTPSASALLRGGVPWNTQEVRAPHNYSAPAKGGRGGSEEHKGTPSASPLLQGGSVEHEGTPSASPLLWGGSVEHTGRPSASLFYALISSAHGTSMQPTKGADAPSLVRDAIREIVSCGRICYAIECCGTTRAEAQGQESLPSSKTEEAELVNKKGDWSLHRRLPSAMVLVECESRSLGQSDPPISKQDTSVCSSFETRFDRPVSLHYLALFWAWFKNDLFRVTVRTMYVP